MRSAAERHAPSRWRGRTAGRTLSVLTLALALGQAGNVQAAGPPAPAAGQSVDEQARDEPVTAPCKFTVPPSVAEIDGASNYKAVKPGDVICLPAGTRGNLKLRNLNGAAGRPIIVRNSGGPVVITGTQFGDGAIVILGDSYLRVTGAGVAARCGAGVPAGEEACGIELKGAVKGVTIQTDHGTIHDIEIDHLFVHETSRDKRTRGIAMHPLERQVISGITVDHNHVHGTLAEGIYLGTEPHNRPLDILPKLEHINVSYNLVEETGYDGIKIKTAISDVDVHHNVILGTGHLGDAEHQGGIKIAFSSGNFHDNIVIGSTEGIKMGRVLPNATSSYFNNIVIGVKVVAIEAPEDDARVFDNLVVASAGMGINAPGRNAKVFGNTVLAVSGTPIIAATHNMLGNLTKLPSARP